MENKKHFKMYKDGKHWVVAGIVTAALALGITGIDDDANAATVTTDEGQNTEDSTDISGREQLTQNNVVLGQSNESDQGSKDTDTATTTQTAVVNNDVTADAVNSESVSESPTSKTDAQGSADNTVSKQSPLATNSESTSNTTVSDMNTNNSEDSTNVKVENNAVSEPQQVENSAATDATAEDLSNTNVEQNNTVT